jgi:uncharacterized protein (TIGR02145 family)
MKKFVYLAGLLLCSAALAGCVDNDRAATEVKTTHISLTAGIDASGMTTRTANPEAPVWTAGDAIGVHFVANDDITNHYRLESTLLDGGATATFAGSAAALAEGDYTIYGYYPHGAAGDGTSNPAEAKIEIPAIQRPTAASFDPAADVMAMWPVSHTHDGMDITREGLQFKRVLSMIRFLINSDALEGQAVTKLTFTTDNDDLKLAGKGHFDLSDGTLIGFYDGAVTSVTAEPAEEILSGAGTTDAVTFCVPVMTIPAGTTLTVEGETEGYTFSKTLTLSGDIALEAGNWWTMTVGSLNVEPKQAELQTPPHARTATTWVVEIAGGAKQIWSDDINVPECDKTTYNGGNIMQGFQADCRNVGNAAYSFIYSWPYVEQNAATLCPAPWSVPSQDDFIALNVAFGGQASGVQNDPAVRDRFVGPEWGGEYGGRYTTSLLAVGREGYYWSRTTHATNTNAMNALSIFQSTQGSVGTATQGAKANGLHLRCVIND